MNQQTTLLSNTSNTDELFDPAIDRRNSDSAKWNFYGEEILPLWVADMDFASPKPILDALHKRIDHGVFGYASDPVRLRELICDRLDSLYNWQIAPDQIVFLPGLVSGLNLVARASGEQGSGIMVNTPIYPPFLSAPTNQERVIQDVPLAMSQRKTAHDQSYLHYEMDFDAMDAAVEPNTRLFMLCNPHNPVGRAYDRAELEQLATFCLRHNLTICSDEIHSDLLLGETKHIPIAALNPEIAAASITLMAPSKTFNIPGLGCSLAIIPNSELRQRLEKTASGIVPHVNLLGFVAATAAYEYGESWLASLREYLTVNRNRVFDFFKKNLPDVEMTLPEATYLAWLDFRAYGITDPYQFFLDHAKIALGSGTSFGAPGKGYARLNFGTTHATLEQALERMADALTRA
ncbi:MAG: PatB family C-S lyase [Caldilineaceae bacterium]|nr:PatB family C-S lyase [Caldilineaceae bacterium]